LNFIFTIFISYDNQEIEIKTPNVLFIGIEDLNKNILDHELLIISDIFLPVDSTLFPTGNFKYVTNTIFDFRKSKKNGFDIDK